MSDIISVDYEGHPLARGNVPPGDLPSSYRDESIVAIRDCAQVVMLELGYRANNVDFDHVGEWLASVVASGEDLARRLDWLEDYYRNQLQLIVSEQMEEEAICLHSLNEIVMGNVFGPGMRIEAHRDIWDSNANLYLQDGVAVARDSKVPRGTIIGHKEAKSHSEILANPLAAIPAKVGMLTIISCNEYPHTIGTEDGPAAFTPPDVTTEAFWETARISFNFSYTTARQLAAEPHLAPMTDAVGFSRPVLGVTGST